ncbi:MAG: FAD-dependent oxidoreductase [Actinobacteria bacterium]|nr:FAD-dependent oxidoreductase [Actinomycetota bacterium]
MSGRQLSRREALRLGGAAVISGALAACTHDVHGSGSHSTDASLTSPAPSGSGSGKPSFAQLAPRISGGLVLAGAPGYDAAALLYNPRFARQAGPAAIAHCRSAADVAACVEFAAAGGAALRLRNGGHSYGGWSSGTGLVADLSGLNSVVVDTNAMTATVGGGALLANVYAQLAASNVAIGAGSCPTVGISGLTLGGGVGVLSRAYGLTCDQLRSAQIVTADGQTRTIDAQHEPDLFWALRGGGGGSFAAVTSLTFAVRPAPQMSTYFLQWPYANAGSVFAAWQQWLPTLPRELWATCKLLNDPGHGPKITVSGTWIGSGSVAAALASLLAQLPKPSVSSTTTGSYGSTMLGEAGCSNQDAGSCITGALAPAKRQAFAATSSIMQQALPEAGIAAIVAAVGAADVASMVEGGVSFDAIGGAIGEVASDATAFPYRTALATVQYTATWPYAQAGLDPAPFDSFVRGERAALSPWLGSAAYVNYADASITDFAAAYWGANAARLKQIKQTYDPSNVFSFPQSVPL